MKSFLVIAEKPSVAKLIAYSIGKNVKAHKEGKVTYYSFHDEKGNIYYVCPCIGHLFEADFRPELRIKWFYPVITDLEELQYSPRLEAIPFIEVIKKLMKEVNEIIIATDFDREGSLIGLECLEQIGNISPKDSSVKRMLFNALTKRELEQSFQNLVPFDFHRALAGKVRAWLDLIWGANLTRALTTATSKYGKARVISAGRVQTPTLRFIYERFLERERFIPKTYWKILIELETEKGEAFEAVYIDRFPEDGKHPERIFDVDVALTIKNVIEELREGNVKIESKRIEEEPPFPLSISILQKEAEKYFHFSPDYAKKVAQSLYEKGIISYPRSSSTKFDLKKGKHDRKYFQETLEKLSIYDEKASSLVLSKTNFIPKQGRYFDGAHPPIHAVELPKEELRKHERMLYDLIWRRTFSLFAESCIKEIMVIYINIGINLFKAEGIKILNPGWRSIYTYLKGREVILPFLKDGDKVSLKEMKLIEDKTKPPSLYTPANVIKQMEKMNIGTAATRDHELSILYKRGYVKGRKYVIITSLGKSVIEGLKQVVEDITLPNMTSEMEKVLDEIERGNTIVSPFVMKVKESIVEIMDKFKKKESEIGRFLASSL